ncbi:MAG: hypothetical protein ACJ78Q_08495 [Chloroflexia bacterium]
MDLTPDMTDERRLLTRYAIVAFAVVGGLEWLLNRTVSRVAAAPPLEGTPRAVVEALGRAGYFLVSPAFLLGAALALLAALGLGASALRDRKPLTLALAIFLALFFTMAIAHFWLAGSDWLNAWLNLLAALAIWWVCILFLLQSGPPRSAKAGVLLIALAYTGNFAYVLEQLLGNGGDTPGALGVTARDMGELLALFVPIAFFAATALPENRWRSPRRWVLPVILALLFSISSIVDALTNKGYTGVFTTWSLGFYAIWPWPLYSLSLALFAYSILTCLAPNPDPTTYANPNTGLGLLFLLFAGYNLQLPYQHIIALLSLMLLTQLFTPLETAQPQTSTEARVLRNQRNRQDAKTPRFN